MSELPGIAVTADSVAESAPGNKGGADQGSSRSDPEVTPFLQHHFDSPRHQMGAGKLGVWLFLVVEGVFFAGLVGSYLVYRNAHPEIFAWAHYFLDTNLAVVSSFALLVSSVCAAWAVRNVQLGEQKRLVTNLAVTIICALAFLGSQYTQIARLVDDGLLLGERSETEGGAATVRFTPRFGVWELSSFRRGHPGAAAAAAGLLAESLRLERKVDVASSKSPGDGGMAAPAVASEHPESRLNSEDVSVLTQLGVIGPKAAGPSVPSYPQSGQVFFALFFLMVGLHGLFALVGLLIWFWLLFRTRDGHFGPAYFGPLDNGALYWHSVNLIWIFLFPLLYLIR